MFLICFLKLNKFSGRTIFAWSNWRLNAETEILFRAGFDKRSKVFKWILDLSGDRDGRPVRVFSHIPNTLLFLFWFTDVSTTELQSHKSEFTKFGIPRIQTPRNPIIYFVNVGMDAPFIIVFLIFPTTFHWVKQCVRHCGSHLKLHSGEKWNKCNQASSYEMF